LIFDSVFAIAISYVVSCWIDLIVVSIPLKKLIGYGFADQMKDNFKTLLSALVMGAVVFAIGFLPLSPMLLLCVQIACGIVTYVSLCFAFKIDIIQSVFDMLKRNNKQMF
jgi:hypothetical protein